MSELKEYYYDGFKENDMLEFHELRPWQLKLLRDSFGFANWKKNKRIKEFKKTIREAFVL